MTKHVSVVIPTYHRPQLLERCLAALAEQDYPLTDFEVIVVDAANDPATRAQVESWNQLSTGDGSGTLFCYIPLQGKNHGPAAARNAGWRAAGGEIIAFTDDDCIPTPSWLAAGAGVFVDGVKGASGRVIVPVPDHPSDYELNAAELGKTRFVTANCFYTRKALEAVRGFDERFPAAWREDTDLFFTLLENDGKEGSFVTAGEATVLHPVRPAEWGTSLRQQKKSIYNALLYKKHPKLYRQTVPMDPPWHYYRILCVLVGAIVGLLLGRKRLSLLFGVFWLLLTGRFTARRLKNTSHSPAHVAEMTVTSIFIPILSIFWRISGALRYRVFFF